MKIQTNIHKNELAISMVAAVVVMATISFTGSIGAYMVINNSLVYEEVTPSVLFVKQDQSDSSPN